MVIICLGKKYFLATPLCDFFCLSIINLIASGLFLLRFYHSSVTDHQAASLHLIDVNILLLCISAVVMSEKFYAKSAKSFKPTGPLVS